MTFAGSIRRHSALRAGDNGNASVDSPPRQSFFVAINGQPVKVTDGTTVAVAILQANSASRLSVSGEPRQPLCGMGICYECRAEVDGQPHQRTCQILCRPGMKVVTG
jgi:D-hydroxyproline dehydrogenase subunit gamma